MHTANTTEAVEATDNVDRRAQTTHVAPVYVRPLLEEAERAGVDPQSLCRGLGLTPEDLELPGFMISHLEACTVVRRALAAIGNPNLGLELGMRSNIVNRGALGLGILASATMREATQLALRFPASAGFLLEVQEQDTELGHALVASPMFGNHDIAPFLVDNLFASIVKVRRTVSHTDYAPRLVELVRSKPSYAADYENVLRCEVRFGCERNRLISAPDWLDLPLPTADARSFRLACQLLEREQATTSGMSSIGLTVERAIRRALPRPPAPAQIAATLNMSERSLRRRLADVGLGYQSLLDDARKSRALELIVNGRMPLTQVATASGFSDLRTFRRAFKRWTGRTPSEMKQG